MQLFDRTLQFYAVAFDQLSQVSCYRICPLKVVRMAWSMAQACESIGLAGNEQPAMPAVSPLLRSQGFTAIVIFWAPPTPLLRATNLLGQGIFLPCLKHPFPELPTHRHISQDAGRKLSSPSSCEGVSPSAVLAHHGCNPSSEPFMSIICPTPSPSHVCFSSSGYGHTPFLQSTCKSL